MHPRWLQNEGGREGERGGTIWRVDPNLSPEAAREAAEIGARVIGALAGTSQGREIVGNFLDPVVFGSRYFRSLFLGVKARAEKREAYFDNELPLDLGVVLQAVPAKQRIDPDPQIAIAALAGVSLTFDEPRLRDLYLNLLAASTDVTLSSKVHPSFVSIIEQMSAAEAPILNDLLDTWKIDTPIAQIRFTSLRGESFSVTDECVVQLLETDDAEQRREHMPMFLANWQRLGLITISFDSFLQYPEAYSWVPSSPEYQLSEQFADPSSQRVDFVPGVLRVTAFGAAFAKAVLPRRPWNPLEGD